MKRLIVAVWIAAALSQPAIAVAQSGSTEEFDNCILENMKGVKSDEAARAIRNSCRNLHSKWEVYRTIVYRSSPTQNNHEKNYNARSCDHSSPEGKYCADEVEIVATLMDEDGFEYRFQQYEGNCPSVYVAKGPKGWMEVLSCSLDVRGKRFEARVKGWTSPQEFATSLVVERRKR